MARRRKKAPTVKQIAVAALVKAVAAEKQARAAQRRIRRLEQEEAKERENAIGFRLEQVEDDDTLPEAD